MATPEQEIFKRIVLRNKLLDEAGIQLVLDQTPDPEDAIRKMVADGSIPVKTAKQLLAIFLKKLEKSAAESKPAKSESPSDSGLANALQDLMEEAPPPKPPEPVEEEEPIAQEKPVAEEPAPPDEEETPTEPEPTPDAAPPPEPVARAIKIDISSIDVTRGDRELIHGILAAGRQAGASDVYIKSGEAPTMRRISRLQEMGIGPISPEVCEAALHSILTDAQRKLFTETLDLDLCYDGGEELGRFRTNYFQQHRGIDGVFRLIPTRVPSFEELNLPAVVKKLTEYRQGIVLITGPKGCGKTTTMAAMVDLINSSRPEHIITIEDPIEFIHPCKMGHVNQREVGRDTQSFSNALRASLREAPDVIMVGEMRDLETTSLAITAAETGHLVFATLHTPDAVRTIGRVLDVFPPKQQGQIRSMVSESLRGIVSQQLVPSTDGESLELAIEILINTSAISHLIRDERTHQLRGMVQTGKKQGMILLDDSLVALVRDGKIRSEEALSRAADQAHVQKELGMEVMAEASEAE